MPISANVTYKPGCSVCGTSTKRGKRYCFDHVGETPKVIWILGILAGQEAETAAVRKTKSTLPIEEESLTVKEIVNILYHKGPITSARVARELSMSLDVIKIYIRYMNQMAIVSLRNNKRGNDQFVKLEVIPEGSLCMPVYL